MINHIQRLSKLLFLNSFNKLAAVIIALFLWSHLSDWYIIENTYVIPVNISTKNLIIDQAPHQVMVSIRGLRKYLRLLDIKHLIINIPESEVLEGNHVIALRAEHMGLPPSLTLSHYAPANFSIQTRKSQNIPEEPVS